jgi:PmbA protein
MLGKDQALDIVHKALDAAKGSEQAEALLFYSESALTRFAENHIHQNVAETSVNLQIRVIEGKKIGVASGNRTDPEGIQKIVESAQTVARNVDPTPDFVSLPKPEPWSPLSAWHDSTARQTPEDRANGVGQLLDIVKAKNFHAAGSYSVDATEMAIANSLGITGYHPYTTAELTTVVMGDGCSGYAHYSAGDVRKIDAKAAGREATDKCFRGLNPREIDAGKYDVILEEDAVVELMNWMDFQYFSARAVEEGRSFMSPFNFKVMGDNITIYDDATDPAGIPAPFDYEGYPAKKVMLIEKGVTKAVVYDSYYANKEGKPNTGHALPGGSGESPIPMHLFLAAGDVPKEKMLERIERGIWVSRFHYVNGFVDPINTIFTGMTRDGTFLIENGKIVGPIKNLRFTQSMLEAFSNVDCLTPTRKVFSSFGMGGMVLPAVLIRGFNFSSKTGH